MIGESWPWCEELLHVAQRLVARRTQRRWTERTAFLLERDIMVSAYTIRKLCEALKLSTAFKAQDVPLSEYRLRGSPQTVFSMSMVRDGKGDWAVTEALAAARI